MASKKRAALSGGPERCQMTKTESSISNGESNSFPDLKSLRLGQSYNSTGVESVLRTVEVGKPDRQHFVRVHPGEDYRMTAALLTDKESGMIYLVAPNMTAALGEDWKPHVLYTAITRQGRRSPIITLL